MVFWAKNLEKIAEKERRKAKKKAAKEKAELEKQTTANKILFFNKIEKEIDKKITNNCIRILEEKRFFISKQELYHNAIDSIKNDRYANFELGTTVYNEVFEEIKNYYRKAGWIVDENQNGLLTFKRK